MAELADALDSGSSRYCTGGGSSPLARMETIQKWIVFFLLSCIVKILPRNNTVSQSSCFQKYLTASKHPAFVQVGQKRDVSVSSFFTNGICLPDKQTSLQPS